MGLKMSKKDLERKQRKEQEEKAKANKILINNIIVGLIFIIGIGFMIYLVIQNNLPLSREEKVALCISRKNITLYVSSICPHCTHQKEMLGKGLDYLDIVDCVLEYELCSSNNITLVPTWAYPDGQQLVGAFEIDLLAKETGCDSY